MKKLIFLLLSFCLIFSFISNGQERNDEVRQKLQVNLNAQSEKLTNITGWSKIENQDGKFWKQSDPNSETSYLPGFKSDGFSSIQMYKFNLEGETFNLFAIYFPSYGSWVASVRHFVIKSISVQKLQNIITSSDGKWYSGAEIAYGDASAVRNLDPNIAITNKEMIRCLILGEKPSSNLNGGSLFYISSQVLKGDTLVRFTFLIGGSRDLEGDRNRINVFKKTDETEDYFELKKKDFEKLFKFHPYTSLNKSNQSLDKSSQYLDAVARAEKAFNDGLLRGAVMIYKEAQLINPGAVLPSQKIKEIEILIDQRNKEQKKASLIPIKNE